jgi:hypothetical protein
MSLCWRPWINDSVLSDISLLSDGLGQCRQAGPSKFKPTQWHHLTVTVPKKKRCLGLVHEHFQRLEHLHWPGWWSPWGRGSQSGAVILAEFHGRTVIEYRHPAGRNPGPREMVGLAEGAGKIWDDTPEANSSDRIGGLLRSSSLHDKVSTPKCDTCFGLVNWGGVVETKKFMSWLASVRGIEWNWFCNFWRLYEYTKSFQSKGGRHTYSRH